MVKEKLKRHVINLLEMKKKMKLKIYIPYFFLFGSWRYPPQFFFFFAVLYVTQHIMVNASWRHFPGKIGENSRHST